MRTPPNKKFLNIVFKILCQHTIKNPIKSEDLIEQIGLPRTAWRRIVDAVALLRERGYPIASSQRGYYLASSPSEIQQTIDRLTSNARAILKRITFLKRWQKRKDRLQLSLIDKLSL
jgi:biotin operon repressor